MIDRLREQIQKRLDELTSEAERLRRALAALSPGSAKSSTGARTRRTGASSTAPKPAKAAKQRAVRTTQTPARARRNSAPTTAANATPGPKPTSAELTTTSTPRTRRGATQASVLSALQGADAMTAGQVAAKTGLGRGTVSTTLSKLAKSGAVEKAQRGYRLPAAEANA